MRILRLLPLLALFGVPVAGSPGPVSVMWWGPDATSCDMTKPALVNVSNVQEGTCVESNGVVFSASCFYATPARRGVSAGASAADTYYVSAGFGKMATFSSMDECQQPFSMSTYGSSGYALSFEIGDRFRQHCSVPYDGQAYAVDCTGQNYFDGSVQRNAKPFNISVVYWKNAKRCDASVPTTYAQQSVQNGLTVSAANGYNYTVQCWDNTVDSTYSIYINTDPLDVVGRYQYLTLAQGDSNNACEVQRSYIYNYEQLDQQLDSFAVDCTGQNNFQNVYGTQGNRVTSALVYPVHQLVTVNGQSLYATSAVCGSDADCPQQATCTENQCICKAGYGGDNTCSAKTSAAASVSYSKYWLAYAATMMLSAAVSLT